MSSREEGNDQQDVSPAALYRRLQLLVGKAAQIAAKDATIKDGEGLDALQELLALLSEKLELSHLTTEEALIRSVLLIVESRYSQDEDKIQSYNELIQSHLAMTFNCNASAVNTAAFLIYVSLVLALHYTYEGTQAIQNELTLVEAGEEQSRDIIAIWTGFQGGPLLDSRGRYDANSLHIGFSRQDQTQAVDQLEALFGIEATRVRLREAYSRVSGDAVQSQQVWSLYHQFEITHLPASPSPQDLELVQGMYVARLRAPHAQLDATLSSYSTFVTKYFPAKDYEAAMTNVYKVAANAKETWAACEPYELQLTSQLKSHGSTGQARWAAWKGFISWISHSLLHAHQKRGNTKLHFDLEGVCAVFERAIASCGLPSSCSDEVLARGGKPLTQGELGSLRASHQGKREDKAIRKEREQQEVAAEREASVDLWKRYLTLLSSAKASSALTLDVCTRAGKAIASSGLLQAHIIRTFCRLRREKAQIDEYFFNALGQLNATPTPTPASIVELVMAWLDVQREIAAGSILLRGEVSDLTEAVAILPRDGDSFMEVYSMMTFALNTLEEKSIIDDQLRVEQLASEWCLLGGEETAALAEEIWNKATHVQPSNSLAWQGASQYYRQRGMPKRARGLLKQALIRRDISSDKKVIVAEELVKLEHLFGGVSDLEWALEKVDSEREKSWAEYYATYTASQEQPQYPVAAEAAPDVDMADGTATGEKRKAQDEEHRQPMAISTNSRIEKRGREGDVRPVRDRENSSVLVDLLPADATTDDILSLFKDCGEIKEITGPKVVESDQSASFAAALVEFTSRDSIPTARSRQFKAVRSSQVNISMGWECTLYVTNFAPEYDSDDRIRQLFAPHGRIFDVRWPSKKFANSRRFCYVQYCDAQSAQSALGLHQMEMVNGETGETISMQVALSDPNRRKIRSDAQSNERELFISGLPRHVSEEELTTLFGSEVESVRIPKHPDGRNKGIAFVDMKTALDAQTALGRSNQVEGGFRINGKLLTVTAVDKTKGNQGSSSASAVAPQVDRRDCRVRVRGLPLDAQEAIIQQIFEGQVGAGAVRRVDWTPGDAGRGVATVELQDVATAGRVALMSSIKYDDDHPLQLSTLESKGAAASIPEGESAATFAPRQAMRGRGGRGRGGVGFARRAPAVGGNFASTSPPQESTPAQTHMQVDSNGAGPAKMTPNSFREMLKKG